MTHHVLLSITCQVGETDLIARLVTLLNEHRFCNTCISYPDFTVIQAIQLPAEPTETPLPSANLSTVALTPPNVEPEVEPNVEPNVEPEVVPEVEPEVAPEVEPNVEPDVEPEVAPEVEPNVEPDVEPEVVAAQLPQALSSTCKILDLDRQSTFPCDLDAESEDTTLYVNSIEKLPGWLKFDLNGIYFKFPVSDEAGKIEITIIVNDIAIRQPVKVTVPEAPGLTKKYPAGTVVLGKGALATITALCQAV